MSQLHDPLDKVIRTYSPDITNLDERLREGLRLAILDSSSFHIETHPSLLDAIRRYRVSPSTDPDEAQICIDYGSKLYNDAQGSMLLHFRPLATTEELASSRNTIASVEVSNHLACRAGFNNRSHMFYVAGRIAVEAKDLYRALDPLRSTFSKVFQHQANVLRASTIKDTKVRLHPKPHPEATYPVVEASENNVVQRAMKAETETSDYRKLVLQASAKDLPLSRTEVYATEATLFQVGETIADLRAASCIYELVLEFRESEAPTLTSREFAVLARDAVENKTFYWIGSSRVKASQFDPAITPKTWKRLPDSVEKDLFIACIQPDGRQRIRRFLKAIMFPLLRCGFRALRAQHPPSLLTAMPALDFIADQHAFAIQRVRDSERQNTLPRSRYAKYLARIQLPGLYLE